MKIKILFFLILFPLILSAQYSQLKKYELNGYITNMQMVMFEKIDGMWTTDNLFHNRLNFKWYPVEWLTASVQMRNRLMYGDKVRGDNLEIGYVSGLENDNGLLDMTWNLFHKKSFVLNSTIDRAWIAFEKNQWNIKLGRQRINWGQTFVWNPNDLFNVYSFFDFDYAEKPGSDAIRIQRYTGTTSSVEAVIKTNRDKKVTTAGLFRFNKWNYDIQFLAGLLQEQDYVIGTGWSGDLKGASFRGEMSYFQPKENFSDTTGQFIISTGLDYTFGNSLMLQAEFLYCQIPKGTNINNFEEFYARPLTVKNLSFTQYNTFIGATYPLTPLLNTSFNAMWFPKIDGFAIIPNLSYSLKDNLDLSFFMQFFSGKFPNQNGIVKKQKFSLCFLRLKGNF